MEPDQIGPDHAHVSSPVSPASGLDHDLSTGSDGTKKDQALQVTSLESSHQQATQADGIHGDNENSVDRRRLRSLLFFLIRKLVLNRSTF